MSNRPNSARMGGRPQSSSGPATPASTSSTASANGAPSSSSAAGATAAAASAPSSGGAASAAERGTRVQVAVRIRPINRSDGPDARVAVRRDEYDVGSILVDDGKRGRTYSFDHVFCGGQEDVFRAIGEPMLEEAYKGFNVCLFAYGQTGSGKTYSIQGDAGAAEGLGVIPRFVKAMFQRAQQQVEEDPRLTIKFTMSYLEIYMEKIRDLLAPRVRGQEPESLELHEDAAKRVYVKDIGVHSVLGYERVMALLEAGNENRQTAETKMNEFSSRSHSIVQITISQLHEDIERRDIESVVSLVDLAGSERQSKTETTGLQFEEAKRINQSLLMLGRALNSFSDGKSDFISLRESKLTRLLSESFGGNSKTWMLATVSPAAYNLQETLSTLDYATNAKRIENRAEVNKLARQLELKDLRELTARLEKCLEEEREKEKSLVAAVKRAECERAELLEALEAQAMSRDTGLQEILDRQSAANADLRRRIQLLRENRQEAVPEKLTARSFAETFVARAGVSLTSVFLGQRSFIQLPLRESKGGVTSAVLNVKLVPLVAGEPVNNEDAQRTSVMDAVGTTVEFLLTVVGATGIPEALSDRVFCKYSFRLDPDGRWYKSAELENDPNPVWNYEKHFVLNDLSADVVECCSEEPVFIFEVFGIRKANR